MISLSVRKKVFLFKTMSLIQHPVIDNLIATSNKTLGWIPYSQITNIESSQTDNLYYAIHKDDDDAVYEDKITLLLLGSDETCTPTLMHEFARIYSLPTHKYRNDVSQFRRYSAWLMGRNEFIKGFTKHDDKYYMVADNLFYHCYSRYGFCTACGILRCSPVWCICGHKQLSDGWTSNNKQLDEFIKESQLQTNSPNHAYLEWIPFDCIRDEGDEYVYLYGLPTRATVTLIPLEITDETHDLYYAEVNI